MKLNFYLNNLLITVSATVRPSESANLIEKSINSIFTDLTYDKKLKSQVYGKSNTIKTLEYLYDQIRSRSTISVLRRLLFRNLENDTTWFYINKQVATKGIIVLVEDKQESPLGPILVSIKSNDITQLIDWLAPEDPPKTSNK